MNIFLTAFFSAVLMSQAWAGFSKGNGGYGIYCSKDNSWEILDSYEAKVLHGLTLGEQTLQVPFEEFGNRLNKVAPELGINFAKFASHWKQDSVWVESEDLGPIDDVFPSVLPVSCELKLAAFQRSGRYFISVPIWTQLSPKQRGVLVLHEILYRSILDQVDLQDSRPVRALLALLASEQFDSLSQDEIHRFKLINNLNFVR